MINAIVKKKKSTLNNLKNYLYILPSVALVAVFFVTSIIYTVKLSFYKWDGFSPMEFVGMENYVNLFSDTNFKVSVMNTIIWVVCSLVISLAIPLLLAILVRESSLGTFFKNIFYFPTALSGTVGGVIIAAMLSTYGIPRLLTLVGMPELAVDWLAIPYVNTFIMIAMGLWQGIGLNMVLFIAGLNNISPSPIEAAIIEGASVFTMYTKVIFPLLKSTLIVVFLMSIVNSFKVFDSIWVMTKGGPFRSSETLALTMYQESFIRNNFGTGAAIAVLLTVIIVSLSYFNLKGTFKE